MTTKLTDHQIKMCALAGGYEYKYAKTELGMHACIVCRKGINPALKLFRPLTPEDSQNLMADARIDVEWNYFEGRETVTAFHEGEGQAGESTQFIDHYPSATDAMQWAIVLCGCAKGEAMTKDKDKDHD